MKEKDIINGEELEKINNELFASFDPEAESWIGGGSQTLTMMYSFGPNGVVDHAIDYDWAELEASQQN